MKKKIIFLIVFNFTIISFSQVNSGIATFKVHSNTSISKTDSIKNPKKSRMDKLILDGVKNLTYILEFNKEYSKYKLKDEMAIGGRKEEIIKELSVLFAGTGEYITDTNKQEQLISKKHQGQEFNIIKTIEKRKWVLTNEKKDIMGVQCYKAILNISTSTKNSFIEAWYNPKLPFAYGPLSYVQELPGFIMEVKVGNLRYYCTEIKLNPKKVVTIVWPKDIETITEDEYKRLGNNQFPQFKN